jgi:polyketide synthase PksN
MFNILNIISSTLERDVSGIEGAIKSINQEISNIRCKIVDFYDVGERASYALLKQELFSHLVGTRIKIQDNKLSKITYQNLLIDTSSIKESRLKQHGKYVITGGLGNLGLALAEYLAKEYNAFILIMQRGDISELSKYKQDKIQLISEYAKDLKIETLCISDAKSFAIKINELEGCWGNIDGVFHLAALTKGESLKSSARLSDKDYMDQYLPKVKGLLSIAEVFENRNLSFCMLFSSIASVLGGSTLGAYAAANSSMDIICSILSEKIKHIDWVTVAWDGWVSEVTSKKKDVSQYDNDIDNYAISYADGMSLVDIILSNRENDLIYITSTTDLSNRLVKWVCRNDIENEQRILGCEKDSEYTKMENDLREMWINELGLNDLKMEDDFFDLGGHSLSALNLLSKIRHKLKVDVSLDEFYDYSVFGDFLRYVKELYK